MRVEHRRGVHPGVKTADFVDGFAQIFVSENFTIGVRAGPGFTYPANSMASLAVDPSLPPGLPLNEQRRQHQCDRGQKFN